MDSDARADPVIEMIEWCREQLGWTVAELAARAGVHISTCRNLLDGAGVTVHTLRAVAGALNLRVCLLSAGSPRVLREHGTGAALSRHRYHGEPPCPACKAWDAQRKQRQRTRHTPASDSGGEAA